MTSASRKKGSVSGRKRLGIECVLVLMSSVLVPAAIMSHHGPGGF